MSDDDGKPPVADRVGDAICERGETVAVAESCTGGLICSRLTDVPGASEYLDRGLVTYSNDAKRQLLAVARETLDEEGAVSEPVAGQMARGVRDTAGVEWGLSTTGIAGPTGGTDEKPVGTVYIGIARALAWGTGGSWTRVTHHEFDGSRREIKDQIATEALRALLGVLDKD